MSLLTRIDEDVIKALKSGDKHKATTLRGLKSDITYKRIEKGTDLSDDDIIGVLNSAAKRRKDSIEQFRLGNRLDLVEKETAELAMIREYLPEQLSEEKLREMILVCIKETGADSPAKSGLVMKAVMPQVKGQADGKLVSRLVSEMLSGGDK
jgi:uncharacterized protein YqeY